MASFNLVTSLMPLASGSAPQTYRWALGVGILIPVVAGALGFLAFAFVAAAVVVPAIYVVYMYDVNQWEDQPIGVVLGAIGAAAALGVGFTFLWHAGILDSNISSVNFDGNGASGVRWSSLLVLVLLVPIVGEVLKQVGPLVLAGRPQFDDMIDGLTFGVAAGAAFAAAETIVVNRGLFSSFGQVDSPNAGFWVSLILSAAVVKPIVYGAATGIAVASYSGLGAGYDGFKPGYFRGLAEALIANIVFQGGLFFAARLEGTKGAVVGLVWGALIAAALVVRLRYLLHFAVLEAALEAAATGTGLKDSAQGTAYCPSCEMPLLQGANFCVACGTSVRAGSKVTRARNRVDDTRGDGRRAAVVEADARGGRAAGQQEDRARGRRRGRDDRARGRGRPGRGRRGRRRGHAAGQLADRPPDPGRLRPDDGPGSVSRAGAGSDPRRVRGCVARRRAVAGEGVRPGRRHHGLARPRRRQRWHRHDDR